MAVAAEAPTTGWKEDVFGSDWLVGNIPQKSLQCMRCYFSYQ